MCFCLLFGSDLNVALCFFVAISFHLDVWCVPCNLHPRVLHPNPRVLHHTPYPLQPTIYTICNNFAPYMCTAHVTLYTLNHLSCKLTPAPSTLNPYPESPTGAYMYRISSVCPPPPCMNPPQCLDTSPWHRLIGEWTENGVHVVVPTGVPYLQ